MEAFVAVTYAIRYANGKKESREGDLFQGNKRGRDLEVEVTRFL